MQQFLLKILSFYMLALALVPCADTAEAQPLSRVAISIDSTVHPDDHDHHSKDCAEDTCPPFCICDCCSCVISLPEITEIYSTVFTPKPGNAPLFVASFTTAGVKSAIWSPPKL